MAAQNKDGISQPLLQLGVTMWLSSRKWGITTYEACNL